VSSPPIGGDAARVTVTVAVPPQLAFEIFTQEIDLWWRRGPRFRAMANKSGVLHFEGRVGGRLFESHGEGSGETLLEMGRVTAWEPPSLLAFEWRNQNFAPSECTYVEVRFKAVGGKTEVTVEHRGWAALRGDHPARHGMVGATYIRSVGMFWGDLMTTMREHIQTSRENPPRS
jgi:uncharacterized protein YndB with AHSA1/START domain